MTKKRRLKLLGHVARFSDGADTADALIPRLPKHWKRQRGRPQNSWSGTVEKGLKPHNIGLHAARKLAGDKKGGPNLFMVPRFHRRSKQLMLMNYV